MTREEVVQYWEQFDAEIDDIYDTASEEERAVLEEQRKMVEFTISALRQQEVESKLKVVESNAPLTLDELRKMDGEPVYSTKKKQWFFIVHHRDSNSIALVDIWDAAYLPQSAMPLYSQKTEEWTE